MTTSAMALHPESPKGGHINAPQVTDSLVYRVCDHNGLGCQVLWRMAQLVPHVPLRRRTWLDQSKMSSVADFVLTGDQKFDASSCGVSIGIIGISAIDLVNSYWAGHVGFSLKVALDVYLEHSGPVLSNETRQALQAASKSLAPQDLGQCRKALGSSAEGSYVSPLDSEITFPFNQLASANIEADEDGWTEDIRNFQKAVTAMSDSVGSNDWKTVKAEFKKGKDALNHIMSNINQRAEGAAPFQLMDVQPLCLRTRKEGHDEIAQSAGHTSWTLARRSLSRTAHFRDAQRQVR
eukprot:s1847_g2.t1